MQKNDKIELDVIDITNEGLGLAKKEGQVFFVKDALIGDKVEAIITKITKNIVYAKALSIIEKSKCRVNSLCDIANACGGCQLLNLDYKKQLDIKKQNVITCIKKIAHMNVEYDEMIGSESPYHFRNKLQVPFAKKGDDIIYGFYVGRTHHIVPFKNCIVGFKGSEVILETVRDALEKNFISIYDENTYEGVFRELYLRCGNTSKEVSVTYIVNDKNYLKNIDKYEAFDNCVLGNVKNDSYKIVTTLLNINTENNNVIIGKKNYILSGNGYIEDSIGDIRYKISPESFYQVNMEMTKKLYDKVVEYACFDGDENVLDLYCGIGTISLYIAKYVKSVLGIEIIDRAIKDAKENAKLNNITNVSFETMDLSDNDKLKTIIGKYDIVIVDPPRKGLDKNTIETILSIKPDKIVYVSCDPATFARDIEIICNAEYKVRKVSNVDMFPHTTHIETVCLIERIK